MHQTNNNKMNSLQSIFIFLVSSVYSLRNGQKQTFQKNFDDQQPPNTINLVCEKPKPIWTFDGQQAQEVLGSNGQPLFRINGKYLTNAQATSGDYNGNYMCIDGSGETTGIEYVVRINGTSNLSAGAITGIVFAVVFAIIIIVLGLWFAKEKGYLGGEQGEYDENDKLQGHDVEVDDYDRASHAGRFRNAGGMGQTSIVGGV